MKCCILSGYSLIAKVPGFAVFKGLKHQLGLEWVPKDLTRHSLGLLFVHVVKVIKGDTFDRRWGILFLAR